MIEYGEQLENQSKQRETQVASDAFEAGLRRGKNEQRWIENKDNKVFEPDRKQYLQTLK